MCTYLYKYCLCLIWTAPRPVSSLSSEVHGKGMHVPASAVCLLQVEAKTPFARWYEPGSHPMPTDEATADMYRAASQFLQQSGYEHYEISNYAKPGFRCAAWRRVN
jgi:hypothetical protein